MNMQNNFFVRHSTVYTNKL